MLKFIKDKDYTFLKSNPFEKNAVFYKDLLVFYDAYTNLLNTDPESLPNYCYWNGDYCLEGICLFMKDYSSELGFESIKLTLNYLKFLYYSLASYSKLGEFPERSTIEEDYENYKSNNEKLIESLSQTKEKLEKEYNITAQNYSAKARTNIKEKTLSGTFNVLSLLSLIVGIFCVIAPFTFYFLDMVKLVLAFIISVPCLMVGILLFVVFRKLSQKYNATDNGTVYEMVKSKNAKDESYQIYENTLAKIGFAQSEKYEFQNNLNKILYDKNRLTFEEVLKRAREYSILSYNIKQDCIQMFQNQQEDINNILGKLSRPVKIEEHNETLGKIYEEIIQKDWLLYNNLIRSTFISKFIEVASRSFNWELIAKGKKQLPFGLNIKSIAKEPVAFLKDRNSLFVSSTIDKLLDSNYLKNKNVFRIKSNINFAELINLKNNYEEKFYDYEKLKGFNNIFYDKKIGAGVTVPDEIIENYSKIPTMVWIKLKVVEFQIGASNAGIVDLLGLIQDDEAIVPISTVADKTVTEEKIDISEDNLKKTIFDCDEVIEIDSTTVKYRTGNSVVTGYRI